MKKINYCTDFMNITLSTMLSIIIFNILFVFKISLFLLEFMEKIPN